MYNVSQMFWNSTRKRGYEGPLKPKYIPMVDPATKKIIPYMYICQLLTFFNSKKYKRQTFIKDGPLMINRRIVDKIKVWNASVLKLSSKP